MKLLFVNDQDVHLGCLEMEGDTVVIKKYKPEFAPEIVDAPEEDDGDDMGEVQEEAEAEDIEKDPIVSAIKEEASKESEPVEQEEDAQKVKNGPKKFKGGGMF